MQLRTNTSLSYTLGDIVSYTDYYSFGMAMVGRAAGSYRNGFGGHENDVEIFAVDMDARSLDTRTGRTTSIDPMAGLYTAISTYVYALNNPLNAIDPDGRLVIFVNGEVGQFGPLKKGNAKHRANESYWGSTFVSKITNRLKDSNKKFVDGDQGGNPIQRYYAGAKLGQKDAQSIISGLQKDANGNIIESIRFITHSKGSEYANGYIDALRVEIEKQIKEGKIQFAPGVNPIDLVIHNAPHQSDAITVQQSKTVTIGISHTGDILSDDDASGDIYNILTKKAGRTGPADSHAISGFLYEDLRIIDQFIENKANKAEDKYAGYSDALNDVQNAQVGPVCIQTNLYFLA
jgi:RHS repeat-associated protein